MNSFKSISIIFIIVTIFGCKQKVILSKYTNGKTHELLILDFPITKDSDGVKKIFFENGKLMCVGGYRNGKRNGKWTCYHENGKIEWQGFLNNEIWNGEIFCNNIDGTWKKLNVVNGIKQGKTIEFNFDPKIKQHFYIYGQYKNDKENGLWIKKDTAGIVLIKMTFDNGMRLGYFENYYEDGKLKLVGEFAKDGSMVNFKYFDQNGNETTLKEGYKIMTI